MYHKVDLFAPTEWWVDVNTFYRQMHSIRNRTVVSLENYNPEDTNHIVITFDGVYKNILTYAAPILNHYKYPFELFITSDYIGKSNDFDISEPLCDFATLNELQKMEKLGGNIQWHTRSHLDLLNVTDQSIIQNELSIPNELKIFNENSFKYFAYPYGNLNPTVKEITKSQFVGAVSCIQGSNTDIFAFNRLTVNNNTELKKEKISCIVPCYNYGNFLPEALDSILRQTILPDEILIADDASIDNTEEISNYYVKKYPQKIKYVKNSRNLGIVENFKKAVSLTNGEYIILVGADNRLQSNYIEECSNVLNCDKDICVAYTDYKLFGNGAEKVYNNFYKKYQGIINQNFYEINFPEAETINVLEELKQRNFIHGSSMFRRSSYENIGGYKTSHDIPEDYNLFYRMVKIGLGVKKAKNTYLQYRQHSNEQANHIFGLQIMNNLYMVRNKELEGELTLLRKYGIVKIISFLYKQKINSSKAINYFRKNGLKKTLDKILKEKK